MTPSESVLAHALRTCNIELSGSGRRRELALGLEASGLMLFPAEMTQQERIIEIAGKWGGFCAAFRPNPQPAHEPESRASQGNRAHEGGGHRPTGGTGQALKIYGLMITQ
jgi:hypothetical protein